MLLKKDWELIKKRFDALWACELIDRCCASVVSWKDDRLPEDMTETHPDPNDPDDIEDYWKNPQRVLKRNLNYINQCFYAGEAFPVICPYFAPAGHAEFFGGKPHYGLGTIWFEPTIFDLEKQQPCFDPNNKSLKEQLDLYQYLVDHSEGRYLVSMPDHVGAADALSHLMGSETLLIEMIERPKLVKKAIDAINDGLEIISKSFYRVVKDEDGGSTIGWLGTWGRGLHMQMQCDLSVMLSPESFRKFLIPELERQMDWIDYPLYHLDGMAQLRHLDMLLGLPRLKMIQWTNVVGQPPPIAFINDFKRIQQAGKCLYLSVSPEEIPLIMDSLSSKGLFLSVNAENESDAMRLLDLIQKHTHA